MVFIREKKLSNTNLLASRHMRREKASLPVDVRRSKTSLLKFPNNMPAAPFKGEGRNLEDVRGEKRRGGLLSPLRVLLERPVK